MVPVPEDVSLSAAEQAARLESAEIAVAGYMAIAEKNLNTSGNKAEAGGSLQTSGLLVEEVQGGQFVVHPIYVTETRATEDSRYYVGGGMDLAKMYGAGKLPVSEKPKVIEVDWGLEAGHRYLEASHLGLDQGSVTGICRSAPKDLDAFGPFHGVYVIVAPEKGYTSIPRDMIRVISEVRGNLSGNQGADWCERLLSGLKRASGEIPVDKPVLEQP
jgi:hypothetical protein